MHVTLNDLLALVGRLDDAPGFDTPRERFRRFLYERATDPVALRHLVEQGQHSLGEQHRRAVQDALVVAGRLFGFETTFGSYQRVAGAPKFDGRWRSRHRLEVILDIRDDRAPLADVNALSPALAAGSSSPGAHGDEVRLGLCIVTPLYGDRALLQDALRDERLPDDVRIVSVGSLMWLADASHAGHLPHEDLVRLLTSRTSLEFLVDVMKRVAVRGGRGEIEAAAPREIVVPAGADDVEAKPGCWLVTIERDDQTSPEQLVRSVIGGRRLLGIPGTAGASLLRPRNGDWVCFAVPGQGIAGHAQIDSTPEGPLPLRNAHRFGAVFAVTNVDIYDTPRAGVDAAEGTPSIVALSPEEFGRLTARTEEHVPERRRSAG